MISAIVGIVIDFFIAAEMEEIAKRKGCESSRRYFWFSLLLGLPGWIMVAALPDDSLKIELGSILSAIDKRNRNVTQNPTNASAPSVNLYSGNGNEGSVAPLVVEGGKIECPHCGFVQNASHRVCWQCGTNLHRR